MQGIPRSQSAAPGADVESRPADALRPWINLWLTIHFFALAVCLASNLVSSELERRILKVLAPYVIGLSQDYGGVPLEMTRGAEVDYPHVFEVHRSGMPADDWQGIQPPSHILSALDLRWRSFSRLTSMAAAEQNEDMVYLLFERCLATPTVTSEAKVDGVRLVRRATLSYAADRARLAGELPASELKNRTLYECRVVELEGGRVKLLPVLEATRTSKAVLPSAADSGASSPSASPGDSDSSTKARP